NERLSPPAPSQSYRLTILLQLRDQAISLPHNILILPVLEVRPVRLNDVLDAVDRARQAGGRDERTEVLVQELDGDAKIVGHAVEADDAVALQ
ncbi:hypothetical protein LTR16_006230, partial [Cryomyces antarcticus]